MSILLTIGILVLIFVSIVVVLLVLMQRAKDGGVGAAMGGSMAEATFGAETSNVLSTATIRGAIIFFVLAFLLYLGYVYTSKHNYTSGAAPEIVVPAAPAPAATTTTAPVATPPATPAPAQ